MQKLFALVLFFLMSFVSLNMRSQNIQDSIMKPKPFKKPPYLEPGDSIAIVAPSGILKEKEEYIKKAKQLAESWGLQVQLGNNLFLQNNHFAGSDKERAEDFQKALDNPNIKAIWCARGGYGSVRIVDNLNFSEFERSPKWIIGYSDITGIHTKINNLEIESLHAMMAISMMFDEYDKAEDNKISKETLRKTLFGESITYEIEGNKFNRVGSVKAPVVGGNMTLLLTILGSHTQLNVDGKILFIEEIGEYKYHLDRMLLAYKRAGIFDNCKGLIVGNISDIKRNSTKWGSPVEKLVLDALSDYNFPILFGFPAGHEIDNRALILGRSVILKVTKDNATNELFKKLNQIIVLFIYSVNFLQRRIV